MLALGVALLAPISAFARQYESLYEYAYNVFNQLQGNWEQQAYENRLSNSLLTFVVNEDGRLLSSRIDKAPSDKGSGDEVLRFLKDRPFGTVPEHLRGSQLAFTFKFTPGSLQMMGYQILDKQQSPTLASPVSYTPEQEARLNKGNSQQAYALWAHPEEVTADEKVMTEYVTGVQQKINGKWQLPEGVTSSRRAVAQVLIDKKGNLMGAHMLESSGSRTVDKAALSAVYQSTPFAPVPTAFKTVPVQIEYVFDPVTAGE
jgi:TonB family protein